MYFLTQILLFSVKRQDLGVKTKNKNNKYNKKTRERIRRRKQLLQEEFDREGLNLIATYKDVSSCPPCKEQRGKVIKSPTIISDEVVLNKYKKEDLGDKIRIYQRTSPEEVGLKNVYTPPLICLITPPRSDEEKICINSSRIVSKSLLSLETAPKRQGVHFNPGRRVQNSNSSDSHPILVCATCAVKPKDNFCKKCFEQNYLYVHRKHQLEKRPRKYKIRNRKEVELSNKL